MRERWTICHQHNRCGKSAGRSGDYMFAELSSSCDHGGMFTRFRQVTSLTVAALAAAAVLAACSPGTGIGVETTAGTATPSPELREPSTVPSSEQPEKYIDVTDDENDVRFDSSPERPAQFGDPAPGIAIARPGSKPGKQALCSLGPAVTNEFNQSAFLTAGHCADGGVMQEVQTGDNHFEDLGTVVSVDILDSEEQQRDSGVIVTARAAGDDWIAGSFPVIRVMSRSEVHELAPNTPICVNGAVSGVVCSPLISVADTIRYTPVTDIGDSGAPVFVVTPAREAILIGIQQGTFTRNTSRASEATFLEPALTNHRLTAVTID